MATSIAMNQTTRTTANTAQHTPRYNRRDPEAESRLELQKAELMEIYEMAHFDTKWLRDEMKKLDRALGFEGLAKFQNKVIRVIALKLRNEKANRYKTEKQFQVMMQRYSAQLMRSED